MEAPNNLLKGVLIIFTYGFIFIVVICIFAFLATFQLGRKQNKQHNQHYDQSRKKMLGLLSIIYLVVIVIGLVFVYYFILAK
ncbi:hypothetical protein [Shimazuella kribbensis]|uniref:hypothetical protein n=1 Tax=Shimazuella kribbensis TaxID=139808 RepID=UPI0003FB1E38|nr:hypothetical protein [Shimazuella kribbensis]